MRRNRPPLQIYKHKELIDEVNNFFIALKINYLARIELPEDLKNDLEKRYPKPEIFELDQMMDKIISALQEQSEDMVKY